MTAHSWMITERVVAFSEGKQDLHLKIKCFIVKFLSKFFSMENFKIYFNLLDEETVNR